MVWGLNEQGEFTWTPEEGRSALLPDFAPELTMPQGYALAAEQFVPSYRDIPGVERYLAQQRAPLYGEYLMEYDPAVTNASPWATWLGQGQQAGGMRQFDPGFAGVGSTAPSADWGNIVNLARNMAFNTQPQGVPLADMPGYDRYIDILKDQDQAAALTSMATYDPNAGSIYGGLRQAGLNRAYQDWVATRPEATGADWLGYITGQPGMVQPQYLRT